jgi:hypothetical protein
MSLTNSILLELLLAGQEIPSILRNPQAHYRVHKNTPLVPNLSQINPAYTLTSYFSKIHFHIHLPHTLRSTKWLRLFKSSKILSTFLIPPMSAVRPANHILLDLMILITFREEYK